MSLTKSNQELMDEIQVLREIAFDLYQSLDTMKIIVNYYSLDIDGDVEIAEEAMNAFNKYNEEQV